MVPPGVSEIRRLFGEAGAWRDEVDALRFTEPFVMLASVGAIAEGDVRTGVGPSSANARAFPVSVGSP